MTSDQPAPDHDVVDRIAAAAQALLSDGDGATFRRLWASVPVPIRAALAIAFLVGADAPRSLENIAKAGGYSRTSAKPRHGDTIEILSAAIPAVLKAVTGNVRTDVDVAQLSADLQARDDTIRTKNEQLAAARAERDAAVSYATDLHRQLKPEYEEILRTRAERVIDVTPRLRPLPSPPTDDGAS
jgi:hypothetical protein